MVNMAVRVIIVMLMTSLTGCITLKVCADCGKTGEPVVDVTEIEVTPVYTICIPARGDEQDFEDIWIYHSYDSMKSACI